MISLSIRRPVAVAMAYLGISLLGVAAWRNLPIELLPDTELPRLTVNASMRGASPEVTEAFLTAPLESEIQQIRGIENITSQSYEQYGSGISSITAEFALGTDMDFARLDLSERLAALEETLPANATRPTVTPYVPEEFQAQNEAFLSYSLSGPYTLERLRAYVDDEVVPELLRIEGVGAVYAQGGRARMLEIELSVPRIEALGLAPMQVEQAVRNLEIVRSAGRVAAEGGMVHTVALRERADDADEVRRLPLLFENGRIVRLEDVATVSDTFEEPQSYYRIDAQPAVRFTVTREIGSNAVEVADAVKARIAAMEGVHPPGVRLHLDRDQSEDIKAQLSDLRNRAVISAVVIFLVLLASLRSWRSAAITFTSMAFAVFITLNIIYWTGHSLNLLTLMGLAMGFGTIVDNSIVVLENIYRYRRLGLSAEAAAERGSREVVLAVVAATATTIVVLIPFVYLQGELRIYYVPLAFVVGFSQVASLFVTFSFVPALASRVLRKGRWAEAAATPDAGDAGLDGRQVGAGSAGPDPAEGAHVSGPGTGSLRGATPRAGMRARFARPTLRGVWRPRGGADRRPLYVRFYSTFTGWTLRYPWPAVVIALMMLGGSYWLFDKYVTRGAIWRFGNRADTYIQINIDLPRGSELARMDELASHFETRLKATPEVERFETTVNPQYARITATFPDSLNTSWIPVAIKEQMVAYSLGFGGATVRVYGFGPSFYGGGSSPPNYSIQVLGYNYDKVREIADDLARRLLRFSRIPEVDPNASAGFYQQSRASELVLQLDRDRLAMHGLTARQVVQRVASAVRSSSDPRGSMRLGGEEVRFAVKLAGHERMDDLALHELLIPASGGQSVRLGDVATLSERDVQPRILREDQQYQRTVAYEFRGPVKLGDVVRDAVIAATDLPPGYSIEKGNQWNWSTEEQQQIYGVLILSIVLVFMVTAMLFESIRQPLVVLLSVPMALIGVFLTFFYAEATFTREAYIGVIMMGGVVVNNAILLVDHINGVRRREKLPFEAAILKGTLERVRPILMTTASTVLGMLPLVLFSDTADQNIWNALTYAMIGGMLSSTVLILTVTPALYLLFERGPARRRATLGAAPGI